MFRRASVSLCVAWVLTGCSLPLVGSSDEVEPVAPSIRTTTSESPGQSGSVTSTSAPADTTTTSLAEPTPETDIEVLADYVEEATGRTFDGEPDVNFVPDGPDDLELGDGFFNNERMWDLLILLGLIEPGDDMNAAAQARLDQVRGFCCPVTMFQTDDHPLLTSVVVIHELTHLIDLDLLAEMPFEPGDEPVNLTAAVSEGNAQRVALAYQDELQDDGARSDRFTVDWSHPDIPEAFLQILEFPYQEGGRFSTALEEVGGLELVDQSFRRPPLSSKQVLDVDAYVDGERPVPVQVPLDVPDALHTGVIGAFVLKLLLEQHVPNGDALVLARKWAGDAYVIHRSQSDLCLAATVAMESADDVAQLQDALRESDLAVMPGGEATEVNIDRCLSSTG